MGCYAASSGNFLPTFWDKGSIGCPETSVRNYNYSFSNNPEERSSQLSFILYNVQNISPFGKPQYSTKHNYYKATLHTQSRQELVGNLVTFFCPLYPPPPPVSQGEPAKNL